MRTRSQTKLPPRYTVNLDALSGGILQELARFLDSSDMIALTQVCRPLRHNLIDNPLWRDLLARMEVILLSPFEEVLQRCDGCARYQEGKAVHKILNLRLCKKCHKSRKFGLITKDRGMKSYWVKEEEFEGLRKVPGASEKGEDLYLREDVKALQEAKRQRLNNAIFSGFVGLLQEQTGGRLVRQQSGNALFIGPSFASQ
jgi:hypothetical protein